MSSKYKVLVRAKTYTHVEVTAENEEQAKEKAIKECEYGYHQWSDRPTPYEAEVKYSGPADEPLVKFPEDWQIYSSMKGADKVNAKITANVRMACADMLAKSRKNEDIGPKYVRSLMEKYIDPVFKKYREYGTYDSEPMGQVRWFLAGYASKLGAGSRDSIYDHL